MIYAFVVWRTKPNQKTENLETTEHHHTSVEEQKEKKRQSRKAAQRLHKELIDDESDVLSSVAAFVLYENEVGSLNSQKR